MSLNKYSMITGMNLNNDILTYTPSTCWVVQCAHQGSSVMLAALHKASAAMRASIP
jgi:hypothetical protein